MIRDFTEADAESIRQLLSAIPEAAQWLPHELGASKGNSVFRVAEENGKVSGLLIFRIVADEAEILNLAVEAGWRRQGIASRLIEDAFAACKAAGVRTISSAFYMDVPPFRGATGEVLTFTDCAVVRKPVVSQLADIAIAAAMDRRRIVRSL